VGRIVEGGRRRGEVNVVVVGWGGGRGVKEGGRRGGGVDIIGVRHRPEELGGRQCYVGGRGGRHREGLMADEFIALFAFSSHEAEHILPPM